MTRKIFLVVMSACVGNFVLRFLVNQFGFPIQPVVYIGVPIFGFIGALAWCKG